MSMAKSSSIPCISITFQKGVAQPMTTVSQQLLLLPANKQKSFRLDLAISINQELLKGSLLVTSSRAYLYLFLATYWPIHDQIPVREELLMTTREFPFPLKD